MSLRVYVHAVRIVFNEWNFTNQLICFIKLLPKKLRNYDPATHHLFSISQLKTHTEYGRVL
jgi:hypothetical protein